MTGRIFLPPFQNFTPKPFQEDRILFQLFFADTFRRLHPDTADAYSWWSYRFHAREKNAGWRIDYFIVSRRIADRIRAAEIHNEIFGSDHCPVELQIDL